METARALDPQFIVEHSGCSGSSSIAMLILVSHGSHSLGTIAFGTNVFVVLISIAFRQVHILIRHMHLCMTHTSLHERIASINVANSLRLQLIHDCAMITHKYGALIEYKRNTHPKKGSVLVSVHSET